MANDVCMCLGVVWCVGGWVEDGWAVEEAVEGFNSNMKVLFVHILIDSFDALLRACVRAFYVLSKSNLAFRCY